MAMRHLTGSGHGVGIDAIYSVVIGRRCLDQGQDIAEQSFFAEQFGILYAPLNG